MKLLCKDYRDYEDHGEITMAKTRSKSMDVRIATNGASPPEGAGRFGAAWSSEGAVRRSSVTARVSTGDSTLMVGGV